MSRVNPSQWSKWLSLAKWWYNTHYYASTKFTPYKILYGYEPPIHIPYLPNDSNIEAVDAFLIQRENMLNSIKPNLNMAQ